MSRPCCWPKRVTGSECLQRNHLRVRSILPYVVAPPAEVHTTFGQLQEKEDEYDAEDDARVESRRKNIIVSYPPVEVEASYEPLEDATDQSPRHNVCTIKRWDVVR